MGDTTQNALTGRNRRAFPMAAADGLGLHFSDRHHLPLGNHFRFHLHHRNLDHAGPGLVHHFRNLLVFRYLFGYHFRHSLILVGGVSFLLGHRLVDRSGRLNLGGNHLTDLDRGRGGAAPAGGRRNNRRGCRGCRSRGGYGCSDGLCNNLNLRTCHGRKRGHSQSAPAYRNFRRREKHIAISLYSVRVARGHRRVPTTDASLFDADVRHALEYALYRQNAKAETTGKVEKTGQHARRLFLVTKS